MSSKRDLLRRKANLFNCFYCKVVCENKPPEFWELNKCYAMKLRAPWAALNKMCVCVCVCVFLDAQLIVNKLCVCVCVCSLMLS